MIPPIIQQGEFKDTKEVIRIRKSKNDRQHNGKKKKNKETNNELQNIELKIEHSESHLKQEMNSGVPEG